MSSGYFVFLGGVTLTYLVLVEVVKRRLMRKLLGVGPETAATTAVAPPSEIPDMQQGTNAGGR
jgi:hypothetical protein